MSEDDKEADTESNSGTPASSPASDLASNDAGQAVPDFDPDRPYTESEIIMTAVRIVTPFVLTYGFFMTFHGADSPGGGFQGGALVAVVVFMLAFAFGIRPTREWVGGGVMTGLATGGVIIFASVGLGALALGGTFLEYGRYALVIGPDATKWGMEAIEIGGVAPIVAGVIMGLFFLTAAGYTPEEDDEL